MALRYVPERDSDRVELIRSFRPAGSSTVVSLWDAGDGVRLPMLRWGNAIYAPVYEGMKLGVDLYNGRDRMIAVPTFIEGANLWVGGPPEPEACSPTHMWELQPRQTHRIDALMNPEGQRGRPIVITEAGLGRTVGEATFGTNEFRGQFRIYERMQAGSAPQAPRDTNQGHGAGASPFSDTLLGGAAPRYRTSAGSAPSPAPASPQAHAPPPASRAAYAAPPPPAPSAAHRGGNVDAARARGHAGFGAGQEEVREHYYTGVEYNRQAEPVVFLRAELRADLEEMLRASLGPSWSWRWSPSWTSDWHADPWTWPVPPTAPYIPVTTPHRGR